MRRPHKVVLAICVVALAALTAGLWHWFEGGGRAAALAESDRVADRLAAADSLAGADSPGARRTLRQLSADDNPRVAVAAVRAIGAGAADGNRLALMDISAGAARPAVRAAAVAALGRYEATDTAFLVARLSDASGEVRAAAAEGLARKRDPAALGDLIDALDDADRNVRAWAITAVSRTMKMRFAYFPDDPPARRARAVAVIRSRLPGATTGAAGCRRP